LSDHRFVLGGREAAASVLVLLRDAALFGAVGEDWRFIELTALTFT